MSTQAQLVDQRISGIVELYNAFYGFYVAELKRDASPFSKYKMELSTVFFETYLEQTKVTYPIFSKIGINNDEKRSVARAALHDALVAHTLGTLNSNMLAQLFKNDEVLATNFNVLKKESNDSGRTVLSLIDEINALKALVVKLSKEPVHAISEGKQTLKGTKVGKQK